MAGVAVGPLLDAVARAVPVGEPVLPLRRPTALTVAVSLASGALGTLVAAQLGMSWQLPAQLWLAGLAVVLTVTDLQHQRLPNRILLPGGAGLAALVVVTALAEGRPTALVGAGFGAAALFALFLLAALLSPAGMGMGDVKLAGVLGLLLGYGGLAVVVLGMLVAFVVHAVVSLVFVLSRRAGRRTALPFGPALSLGAAVALGWFTPLAAVLR